MTERGSSTLLAVAIIGLLVLVGAGLAGMGRLAAAHIQATAAADAAALAAAPLTFLDGEPRREAAVYARANGARLVACGCEKNPALVAREVTVVVEVDAGVLGVRTVRARAAAQFDPAVLVGG